MVDGLALAFELADAVCGQRLSPTPEGLHQPLGLGAEGDLCDAQPGGCARGVWRQSKRNTSRRLDTCVLRDPLGRHPYFPVVNI
jgi:hypothetical protein